MDKFADVVPCFFFDERPIAQRNGLHLEAVPVEKCGVLFESAPGIDLDWVGIFAGTVMPLDTGGFRMYYYSHSRQPLRTRIGVAESADGLHWERRSVGGEPEEGGANSSIRIQGLYEGANITQPSVVRTPDGRWLMYCWLHGQDRGFIRYIISESADGLTWRLTDLHRPAIFHPSDLEVGQVGWTAGLTAANPNARFDDQRQWDVLQAKRLRSNDAVNVYWNSDLNLFEMFSVWLLPNSSATGRFTPHDNAPGVLRVIHRRTSQDGFAWSAPELILTPDGADPLDQQFYYLASFPVADWRIGFLGNYPCWAQTMDIELCFSRDGRQWLRPLRGGFVPRDPVPERGCMSAYAANRPITIDGDRHLLLYTAGNTLHNQSMPEGVEHAWRGIMGAAWPVGRYAGLATASGTAGRLLLHPRVLVSPEITVDANVRGALRAELRDPLGGRIEGFELHRCRPVGGDSTRHILRWGESGRTSAEYQYDAVTLYCEVEDGVLYSMSL